MRSIVFRRPVILICSCRIMDKPDGSGPSDTRSIRVRNIKSFLQDAFKITIHFLVRNRGCPVMIPDCDAPCFLFAISYLKSLKNVIRILSESTSSGSLRAPFFWERDRWPGEKVLNSRSFSMILSALRRGEPLLNSPAALMTSRFRQRCFRAAGCSPHPPSCACSDHEKLAAHSKPFSPGPSIPSK